MSGIPNASEVIMYAILYRFGLRRADRIHARATRAYKRSLQETGAMSKMFRSMSIRLYSKAARARNRARSLRMGK
jgi:hypothetical protein